jgi:hypothetical protein
MTDPTQPRTRSEKRRLTHIDRGGRPRMVDVSLKPPTARRAVAEAEVVVEPETERRASSASGRVPPPSVRPESRWRR